MKIPSLLLAVFFAFATGVSALTPDDITTAALLGKTITFNATGGTGLLPATGTWTGVCEKDASSNLTFELNNTGNGIPEDHSTTCNTTDLTGITTIRMASAYTNSGLAILTLSLAGGNGVYNLSCTRLDMSGSIPVVISATQTGSFTIKTSIPAAPEIKVTQGSANLADGKARTSFGTVSTGGKGMVKRYKIINEGTANLTGLMITRSGANSSDFTITQPAAKTLAPGKSTTFKIKFKPAKKGVKNAAVKIASNDRDENPFDIKLAGTGRK